MFTGIVESMAKIISNTGNHLVIARPESFNDIAIGSSIAVSGVCLSITNFSETDMHFDVVDETLSKTKLGELEVGNSVNLERAMKADGRFEGHVVQGHVDGVASCKGLVANELAITLPKELIQYVVHKGSITIDGVSLTVADIQENTITIALIPHTLEHTTLGELEKGDMVNIEVDILGKYIRSTLPK